MTDRPTSEQPTSEQETIPDGTQAPELDPTNEPTTVEALQEELEQTRAQYQRALADYQNLQRRAAEERTEVGRLALTGVISAFLPVLDDLQRATEAAREADAGSDPSAWLDGVNLVVQKFGQVLQQSGVEEIHALAQPFDPNKHEAVGASPGPEGQVVHILRRGYTLKDRVIRPAMVMVGDGSQGASDQSAPEHPATDT